MHFLNVEDISQITKSLPVGAEHALVPPHGGKFGVAHGNCHRAVLCRMDRYDDGLVGKCFDETFGPDSKNGLEQDIGKKPEDGLLAVGKLEFLPTLPLFFFLFHMNSLF